MPETTPGAIRVYVTFDVLETGRIQEVMATIEGDVAEITQGDFGGYGVSPEGRAWHRTRWAAQNYACQIRNMKLRELRDEVQRLERMDFGLKR